MAQKVRYGILSTSQIGRNAHAKGARESVNSVITALSSRAKEKAERFAQELGIEKAYGSYDEVLADPDIDAIVNPLPNSLHCEWTIRAAQAGKHILCEKPLAVTVDEATRMIEAAQENKVLLMEGFTPQFLPTTTYIRKTVESGEIGEIVSARSELAYTIPDWENDNRAKAELAGGALMDAGCYCVNMLRFAMNGEPESVQASSRMKASNNVDSTTSAILKFSDNRLGYMITSMEQPFRSFLEITGTGGRISVPNWFAGEIVEVSKQRQETHIERFKQQNRFKLQIEHFSDCILNNKPLRLPPEDGLKNTAVLVAIQKASQKGTGVEVVL
jgi:predicted dehydrogenase